MNGRSNVFKRFLAYGVILIIFAGLLVGCGNAFSGKYYYRNDDGSLNTDGYVLFENDNTVIFYMDSVSINGSYELDGNTIIIQIRGESVDCILSSNHKEITIQKTQAVLIRSN